MEEIVRVGDLTCRVIRLLGHGKGGYSYLAECNEQKVVLKQIHHEPCAYYTFGNKIEAEQRDYQRLKQAGIRIPEMLAIDLQTERIVKEFIDGETIFAMLANGQDVSAFLPQVQQMADQARENGLNIDYYPTNFVVQNGMMYYIDYECNAYMHEWSFEQWGVRYWSHTPEFEEALRKERGQ